MENWKEIEGFEGYFISDYGQVQTIRPRNKNSKPPTSPRIMKLYTLESGYKRITLRSNGKPRSMFIHSTVLHHFKCPRPYGLECRHLDGNKANNHINNLAWGTRQENTIDQVLHGTHAGLRRRGSKHPCSKLNEQLVLEIRKRVDAGEECKALGIEYGIPRTTISNIKHRRTYVYLPESSIMLKARGEQP